MPDLHAREREELKGLLKQQQLDRLADRLAVVDAFLETEEHLSADQLTDRLAHQGKDFSRGFVQETLELLNRFGFAHRKDFADQRTVYEHRHLGDHHDHLICTSCGRIVEFSSEELEEIQQAIARRYGFSLLHHRHQLYGLCSTCRAERQPALPLALARPGERLEVVGYLGGRQAQGRLADLGLTPGVEIEVLSAEGGPVVLACRGSRLALGHELAMKLTCRPKEQNR